MKWSQKSERIKVFMVTESILFVSLLAVKNNPTIPGLQHEQQQQSQQLPRQNQQMMREQQQHSTAVASATTSPTKLFLDSVRQITQVKQLLRVGNVAQAFRYPALNRIKGRKCSAKGQQGKTFPIEY